MSLITTRLSLFHRCTVERNVNIGSDDGWGNPLPPDWEIHLADIPCRGWTADHKTVTNQGTIAVIIEVSVMVMLGTDVAVNDRIASITYRGSTIFEGPLAVHAVIARRDYLEMLLSKAA